MVNRYQNYDRNQLLDEIAQITRHRKYGLVWDEKINPENIEILRGRVPVLEEIKNNEINKNENSTNILIEGDNYDVLTILNYTHQKKVDMIYIDPPYNTGDTLMYNNNYVDKDDPYIHSKFLSILHKRLKLAKNILKRNGVICCTIDDYELMSVLGVLDRLGAKVLSIVVIVIKPEGRGQDEHIKGSHEYAIFATFGRNITSRRILPRTEIKQKYAETSVDGRSYRWDTFYRRGDKKPNPEKESRWYPIYVNEKTLEISANKKKDWKEIFPVDTKNTKWIWDMLYEDFKQFLSKINKKDPEIIAKQDPKTKQITIHIRRYKKYYTKPTSYWNHPDYSPQSYGSKLIPKIISKDIKFDYPKSVFAVYDCIDIFLPENGIILDFFAGSGTTGHAALLLNLRDKDIENVFIKKYGKGYHKEPEFLTNDAKLYSPFNIKSGKDEISSTELSKLWAEWRKNHAKRRFIVCTNNEIPKKILDKLKKSKSWSDEEELNHPEGICKKITYPRMKGISCGYKWTRDQVERLVHPISSQGNIIKYEKSLTDKVPKISFRLKHFKTNFIEWRPTIKHKRKFTDTATELLCLKENCFEKINTGNDNKFGIYRDHNNRCIGIIHDYEHVPAFENAVQKVEGKINTYVFSINGEVDGSRFTNTQDRINLKPIPIAITKVYQNIMRDLKIGHK